MSHNTAVGCQKLPTRFLPSGRLTPVFPPMAASTWASSVVGTFTYAMPRRKTDAAKPATSLTTPPPSATTASRRDNPKRAKSRHSCSTTASVFAPSPSSTMKVSEGTPGSTSTSTFSWVTMATRSTPAGRTSASMPPHPRPDEDVVGTRPETDGHRDHLLSSLCCCSEAPVGRPSSLDAIGHGAAVARSSTSMARRWQPPRRGLDARPIDTGKLRSPALRRSRSGGGGPPSCGQQRAIGVLPTRRARVSGRARSHTTVPLSRSAARLGGSRTAPPPTEITAGPCRPEHRVEHARLLGPEGRLAARRRRSRAPSSRRPAPPPRRCRGGVDQARRDQPGHGRLARRPSSPRAGGAQPRPAARGRRRSVVERRQVPVPVAHDLGQRVATELAQRLGRPAPAPSWSRPPRPWPGPR